MANWSGTGRTNHVRVADMEGMKAALKPFEDQIEISVGGDGRVAFFAADECGDFPSWVEDEEGEEFDFDWAEQVVPFLAPGETLVVMVAGAEKLRYVTGVAEAFHWDGHEVKQIGLTLDNIYRMAAAAFGIEKSNIDLAQY